VSTQDLLFPSFNYHLDESDPDTMILRRQDDSLVAAFSASGATREGVIDAAKEDYRQLVQVHLARRSKATPDVEREEIRANVPQTGNPTRSCA
jgi:hypothetical protein